jgi:predicted secreted protein
MGITSALVLFAVIWSMTFLIILPIRVKTQGDVGKIVPGTHAGAPEVHNLGKKARLTTVISLVLWVIISGIILSGAITVRDLDWFGRGAPDPSAHGAGG